MSVVGKLLLIVGSLIITHAAYSVYEDRKFFEASDEKQANIPFDVSRLLFEKTISIC
jgi:hypothetical protein